MKFRIRELSPGYRLEVCVPGLNPGEPGNEDGQTRYFVAETWIPIGHPYGSVQAAKSVAEEFARGGLVVEEFDVEPVAARA